MSGMHLKTGVVVGDQGSDARPPARSINRIFVNYKCPSITKSRWRLD